MHRTTADCCSESGGMVGVHRWSFKVEMKLFSKVINRTFWCNFYFQGERSQLLSKCSTSLCLPASVASLGLDLSSRWEEHGWFGAMERITSRSCIWTGVSAGLTTGLTVWNDKKVFSCSYVLTFLRWSHLWYLWLIFSMEISKGSSLYSWAGARCPCVAGKGRGCNLHLVENSLAPQPVGVALPCQAENGKFFIFNKEFQKNSGQGIKQIHCLRSAFLNRTGQHWSSVLLRDLGSWRAISNKARKQAGLPN